jgi:hypothetical protein
MSLLLIWRHGANIRKLMAGTESKIGQKAAPLRRPSPPRRTRTRSRTATTRTVTIPTPIPARKTLT